MTSRVKSLKAAVQSRCGRSSGGALTFGPHCGAGVRVTSPAPGVRATFLSTAVNRSLLKFDLSSIRSEAMLLSADLALSMNNGPAGSIDLIA
jgi:hypothetical protein